MPHAATAPAHFNTRASIRPGNATHAPANTAGKKMRRNISTL